MDNKPRSKHDRREIHSVCMPVPAIVLDTAADKSETAVLTHSRSTGDLDVTLTGAQAEKHQAFQADGQFSTSVTEVGSEADSRNAIGLYCSPRMPRKSSDACSCLTRQPVVFLDTLDISNFTSGLDPGSRVGSAVSLNSEYTARSVGLISNDSESDVHRMHHGVSDSLYQKHNMLRRFYSSPERDEALLQHVPTVRRNSKSWNNLQGETVENNGVSFEFGSESTDDSTQLMELTCEGDSELTKKAVADIGDSPAEQNLVTAITGGASLREGRIRRWLTEIADTDKTSCSGDSGDS